MHALQTKYLQTQRNVYEAWHRHNDYAIALLFHMVYLWLFKHKRNRNLCKVLVLDIYLLHL